jgi:hypothetical protein
LLAHAARIPRRPRTQEGPWWASPSRASWARSDTGDASLGTQGGRGRGSGRFVMPAHGRQPQCAWRACGLTQRSSAPEMACGIDGSSSRRAATRAPRFWSCQQAESPRVVNGWLKRPRIDIVRGNLSQKPRGVAIQQPNVAAEPVTSAGNREVRKGPIRSVRNSTPRSLSSCPTSTAIFAK